MNEKYQKDFAKQPVVIAYRQAQMMKGVKQIKNNTADEDLKRFQDTLAFFRKYGTQYGFDPLMLAAQGYQESQLNQNAKSHVGAIGIMQIMPPTGKQLQVGDIRVAESNVHAGAKYMDQLMTKYFPDAHFNEGNRPLFAFAAYNAGPGNISKMRKIAAERRTRPGQVVQQRGGRDSRKDRHRNHNVRAQHLQVLRRLQAYDGSARHGPESA